jgi:hypothetical protein
MAKNIKNFFSIESKKMRNLLCEILISKNWVSDLVYLCFMEFELYDSEKYFVNKIIEKSKKY